MLMQIAEYSLVSSIFSFLLWTNHSINFFLYCLSGKRFRQELLRIIAYCFRRKHHLQVSSFGQPQTQRQRATESSSGGRERRESNSSVMSEYLAPALVTAAPSQLPTETDDAISRINRWATVTFAERHSTREVSS